MTKEFLGKNGIAFEAHNPLLHATSNRLWRSAGSPGLPAVMVGDRVVSVIHVSQLYSLLGLEVPAEFDERRTAWDIATLQQAWQEIVRGLTIEMLIMPTPARNRTIRDLVVNVFEVFARIREAWPTLEYIADPDPKEALVNSLNDMAKVTAYIDGHMGSWSQFLQEHYNEEAAITGPVVSVWELRLDGSGSRKGRGKLPFGAVLAMGRAHTALHLRQATVHLNRCGIAHPDDRVDALNLGLPADPFGDDAEKMGRLDQQQLMR